MWETRSLRFPRKKENPVLVLDLPASVISTALSPGAPQALKELGFWPAACVARPPCRSPLQPCVSASPVSFPHADIELPWATVGAFPGEFDNAGNGAAC